MDTILELWLIWKQLDPHIAKAPIILGQEKSDDDSVVKWIREEFTEIKQVDNIKKADYGTLSLVIHNWL